MTPTHVEITLGNWFITFICFITNFERSNIAWAQHVWWYKALFLPANVEHIWVQNRRSVCRMEISGNRGNCCSNPPIVYEFKKKRIYIAWKPDFVIIMTALKLSSYSQSTEDIFDVLYCSHKRKYKTVLVRYTFFKANLKSTENSYGFIEYNRHPNIMRFEDKWLNKFKPDYNSVRINTKVIRTIGLVCNYDDIYEFYPSWIYYPEDSDIIAHYQSSTTNFPQNMDFQSKFRPIVSNNSGYIKEPNYHRSFFVDNKYWLKRYTLFFKYDRGIHLDRESFYSTCPEVLSRHIAKRCADRVALDAFCGAGGNTIQLAFTCGRVIAVDIDPKKIQMARHNAKIYKVAHKIEFIVGDIFELYTKLKANVLFMSPPWGGPGYSRKNYSLTTMCREQLNRKRFRLIDVAEKIAPKIAFHMPKSTNINECVNLTKNYKTIEVQQNIIDGKLNSITAFYGDFN